MKTIKLLFAVCAIVFAASAAGNSASAADEKRVISVFDFFLLDRIPRESLANTVIPVGDNYFTAERFGLQNTMSRIINSALEGVPGYEVLPIWERSYPDPELEAGFNYFSAGDDPRVFFNLDALDSATATSSAHVLAAGVVRELKINKNAKPPHDETVKMKISIVLYDAEEGEFLFFNTYEGDTAGTKEQMDEEALPERDGRVPRDIRRFADSEAGRIFMSLVPGMIKDISAALEAKTAEPAAPEEAK